MGLGDYRISRSEVPHANAPFARREDQRLDQFKGLYRAKVVRIVRSRPYLSFPLSPGSEEVIGRTFQATEVPLSGVHCTSTERKQDP